MYSKDELSSKDIRELTAIVHELGADTQPNQTIEDIINSILKRQDTEEANATEMMGKRRRIRIQKHDTDRVYSVKGKEGENFDLKKNKVSGEQPSLFKEQENNRDDSQSHTSAEEPEMTLEEELAAIPKHRGRKSKRELELIAMIEARKQENNEIIGGNIVEKIK